MTFARRLLLVWLMAWMAVNGALAGTMGWPMSATASEHAVVAGDPPCHDMATMEENHGDHASMAHPPAKSEQQDSGCKHCRLCQIAASMLPLVMPHTIALPPMRAYFSATVMAPPSHIPEPPQHVPLALAA